LPPTILLKVLSNFRRNLTISHFVNGFNTDDSFPKRVFLETLLQLTLGLTRTKIPEWLLNHEYTQLPLDGQRGSFLRSQTDFAAAVLLGRAPE